MLYKDLEFDIKFEIQLKRKNYRNSTRKKERVGNYSSKVEEIKKIEFCLLNLNEDLKFDIIRHIIMTDATTFHNIYEEIEILKLDNSEWNLLLFRH
jgi:hypothetical protein